MAYSYTGASKKSRIKYQKENLHRVPLDMQNRDFDLLKEVAKAAGEAVNGYVKKAISAYSGVSFSWDVKAIENAVPPVNDFPMNPPETGDTGS